VAPPKVVLTPKTQASLYYAKARQFAESAAAAARDGSRNDSAVLCAVHAGISAADAVSVALGGRRSADPDHQRAVQLLEQVAGGASSIKQHADQLRALIRQKNRVEYEDKLASAADARDAVARCERLVSWARDELVRARLLTD